MFIERRRSPTGQSAGKSGLLTDDRPGTPSRGHSLMQQLGRGDCDQIQMTKGRAMTKGAMTKGRAMGSFGLLLPFLILGGLDAAGLEDLKECRMVSGKPGLCVPIRFLQSLSWIKHSCWFW